MPLGTLNLGGLNLGRRSLLAAAGALGAAAPGAAQANELRLGALFPFSGSLALLGDESFRGVELAVEERNAAGGLLGRPLRLVKADAADQAQAVAELRRLATERVAAVFGTFASGLAFAASQVAEAEGLPYFELGAIADSITERGFRNLFRVCPRASDFAQETVAAIPDVLAPLWQVDPARLKLALLQEDSLFGQSVAGFQEARIRQLGLDQVDRIGYPARGLDAGAVVARLRSAGAEVVLHSGYANDIVLFYRALRDAGWKPRMVIGAGAGYSLGDIARALGPDFEGTLDVDFSTFAMNERAAPGLAPFAEAYRRKYGSDPRSGHSLASYCGARVGLDAIQRAEAVDKDRIRAAVLATDVPDGGLPNGWGARFDEKGQNGRAKPLLLQWQGGRLVTVGPASAAVAPARGEIGPG